MFRENSLNIQQFSLVHNFVKVLSTLLTTVHGSNVKRTDFRQILGSTYWPPGHQICSMEDGSNKKECTTLWGKILFLISRATAYMQNDFQFFNQRHISLLFLVNLAKLTSVLLSHCPNVSAIFFLVPG